jgi:tripeptide aminopeptidase
MINKDRILAEFCELVRLKCSSRAEREVGDAVKARLAAAGLTVEEDDVAAKIGGNCGNIFGYLPGNLPGAPVVMLSAHIDSVEPCAGIEPQVTDGIITSCGPTILGADDKAGVVAILEALRVIREQGKPHGGIQVVFTVAEESGLHGSKNMDKNLLKADLGYVLDSGGAPGRIINAAPGQNVIDVTVRGRKAHAGIAPEEGINAIVVAGKALAQLRQGRIDFETTANVGTITGGTATNIVADQVEIACEVRSRNPEKLTTETKHMVAAFEQAAAERGAQAEITVKRAYDPYVLEADSSVVTLARRAAESAGLPVALEATGGGSDANYFNTFGVPSAVLGIGMSKVHTTEEYIKVNDLYGSAEMVLAIISIAAEMKK